MCICQILSNSECISLSWHKIWTDIHFTTCHIWWIKLSVQERNSISITSNFRNCRTCNNGNIHSYTRQYSCSCNATSTSMLGSSPDSSVAKSAETYRYYTKWNTSHSTQPDTTSTSCSKNQHHHRNWNRSLTTTTTKPTTTTTTTIKTTNPKHTKPNATTKNDNPTTKPNH